MFSFIKKIYDTLMNPPLDMEQGRHDLYNAIYNNDFEEAKKIMAKYNISAKDGLHDRSVFPEDENPDLDMSHLCTTKSAVMWNIELNRNGYEQYKFVRQNGLSAEDMLKNKLKGVLGSYELSEDPKIEGIEAELHNTDPTGLLWQAAVKVPLHQQDIVKPIPELYNMVQTAQFFDPDKRKTRRDQEREAVNLKRKVNQHIVSETSKDGESRKRPKI